MVAWLVILAVAGVLVVALVIAFILLWFRLGPGLGAAIVIPLAVIAFVLVGLGALVGQVRLAFILSGGTELIYRVEMQRVPADQRAEAIPWTISVLEKRLSDCLGYASAVSVHKYSSDRILIRLAHVDAADLVRAKSLIVTTGRLEFRLVNDVPDARNKAEAGHPVPGCTPFVKCYPKGAVAVKTEGWYAPATFAELKSCGSDWLLVRNTAEITGQSLARAYATVDWNQSPAVGFEFNAEGRKKFALLTERNIGRQLAIVLDDKLYSAPVIKSRIGGAGIIEGSFTKAQVEDLVVALRSGALLAPLVLESERSFGPARAKESGADRK